MNFLRKKSPFFSLCKKRLEEKVKEPLPHWMEKRIEEDLSPFVGKRGSLPTFSSPIYKFSIRNNRLVAPSIWQTVPRLLKMGFFLRKLLRVLPLADLDFFFTTEDLPKNPPFPLFAISKGEKDRHVALFPHVEWLCYWDRVKKNLPALPWEKREPLLFWRGATTGGGFRDRTSPRWKVVELSHQSTEINAFFSSVCQIDPAGFEHLLRKSVPIESQVKYRYLLSLDGNCFGGSFFWQLASGSLVFKQNSPYLEWYYGGVLPFVHYIPFQADVSDLLSQKKWAEENDATARTIARNALTFSENYLSIEGIMTYVYHLLTRYAKRVR